MSSIGTPPERYDVDLGLLGATRRISSAENEAGISVVEHTLPPKALAAPLHRHHNEDEVSYVLTGEMTVLADDEVSTCPAGEFVVKGRDVWHTFWNAGDEELRFLEIIGSSDFDDFFGELAEQMDGRELNEETVPILMEVSARYDLEMNPESVPELCEKYGLRM
ncbi:cupin domain-containing protein [Halobaculum limi]|uniref:cupin domain-containing protein n=1 Tax=Halobaculum limi TaxID=3031916 RepID=UPI00240627F3|nr:cupin domain-containing protein [Halobaculum sp. YSMS11]